MDYHDSRDASAEYLRLALPLMSRHPAPLDPVTFSVWYEYVSGHNGALSAELDGMMQSGIVLDAEVIRLLHQQHIAPADEKSLAQTSKRLQVVMGAMSGASQRSIEQTQQYGSALEGFSLALSDDAARPGLQGRIDEVLRHTHDIKLSMGELRDGLASNRSEVELLRRELAEVREQAMHDALTGLSNRRAFDVALPDMVYEATEEAQPLTLVMLDIDHFKRVNDTHGHILGDRVLRSVADVVRASIKGRDFAARYGGEEFAVILPATPLGGGQTVAEAIRKSVSRGRIRRQDCEVPVGQVTLSAGVACLKSDETPETLFRRADTALYESKDSGRNRVTVAW